MVDTGHKPMQSALNHTLCAFSALVRRTQKTYFSGHLPCMNLQYESKAQIHESKRKEGSKRKYEFQAQIHESIKGLDS